MCAVLAGGFENRRKRRRVGLELQLQTGLKKRRRSSLRWSQDDLAGRAVGRTETVVDRCQYLPQKREEQRKVSELSLLVHCEVDLNNGGHWEGVHVGAPTWW